MNYSSLKRKGIYILNDSRKTVYYAIHSPIPFVFDTAKGTTLLLKGLIGKNPQPKPYDNRCKSCAKLTIIGLLALGAFIGCCKIRNKHQTRIPTLVRIQEQQNIR